MSSQAGMEKLWPADLFCMKGVSTLSSRTSTVAGQKSTIVERAGVKTKDMEKAIARPQFKGEAFKEFCRRWGILHDPSSPYHHIANGYAEAAVKSMKSLVKKPGRLYLLIRWWSTTAPTGTASSRPTGKAVSLRAKAAYDVGSKELSELQVGDIVRFSMDSPRNGILSPRFWKSGRVGRSYLVKTESGRLYWRNRRYLKLYAPPIGVAKDIPESQEEVKQPRRSRDRRKPL
ncbi:Transposon Tf2-6 polyprotein [Caligus rogercresseyi]|uniref:Transposon Tf2-6 polyprotein n=1 Tax=Caligus rogercresseyi TaxID=217165 RepID=A0A7T8KCK3_CALRO|nr:Transposon Tf2-6 polyprotein [Caligus rogercresseyi]